MPGFMSSRLRSWMSQCLQRVRRLFPDSPIPRPAPPHRAGLCLEALESRYALATLASATRLTYQDVDGDRVAVTFSKPILNAGNVNTIFTFSSGTGAVNGSNAAREQLRQINLVGVAGAAGTTITTSATRSAVNGGDGFAAPGDRKSVVEGADGA